MKATLSNYKQSPRKVRLVADSIRGKSIEAARNVLAFQMQKSSPDLLKLLNSAVANATHKGVEESQLFVQKIAVDKGLVMRRFKPMARGRAAAFRRTMSIITLELGSRTAGAQSIQPKVKATKATPNKTMKKRVTKKTNS